MKIVKRDNYGREGPGHDTTVMAENVESEFAELLCYLLNNSSSYGPDWYFTTAQNDYQPTKWEP
jgi:hypothetical protein